MTTISGTPPHSSINHDWDDLSDLKSNHTAELRKPPSPQNHGFCAWVSNFIHYLSGTFGEKLGCTQLNSALNSIFTPKEGWEAKSTFEYGGTIQVGCRSKQVDGITYVVAAPAHDLPTDDSVQAMLSGGRSAVQTLHEIQTTYPRGDVKVFIPIAQSNTLGCFGTRGHFVLLEADWVDGKIESAKIHDSKGGLLDTFYMGAQHLTKQLLREHLLDLPKGFEVTAEHYGDQSLFNGNDCGRYAAYYAATLIKKGDLSGSCSGAAQTFFKKHF